MTQGEGGRKLSAAGFDLAQGPVLPPAFVGLAAASPGAVRDVAIAAAAEGPGRLVWAEGGGRLAVAATLAAEEALATARRAHLASMAALARAVAAVAAPERAVTIVWPDVLVYDVARLAAGWLAAPEGCAEGERPDWLVVGVEAIAARDHLAEPGRFPGSTSLREEDLGPPRDLVELYASYLMQAFDRWEAQGFGAVARLFLERLAPPGGVLAPNGDLIGPRGLAPLCEALAARAWAGPDGAVRL